MSWWLWAIVAWLVISVPFAVFTAKFIAAGRERPREPLPDAEGEPVVDLPAIEAEEAAAADAAERRQSRAKRALRTN